MSPSGFEIFLFVTIIAISFAQWAWDRSQSDYNDKLHEYIKSVSESTDILNQRLDAHWTYMEALNTRLDTHAGLIELANDKVDDWSDRLLDGLEGIRDMLPKDEEPTSDDV